MYHIVSYSVSVHDKHSNSRSVSVSGNCGMVMGGAGGGGVSVVGTGCNISVGAVNLRDKIVSNINTCSSINRSNNMTVIGGEKRLITSTSGSELPGYWQPVVAHRQPHDALHDTCMYIIITYISMLYDGVLY